MKMRKRTPLGFIFFSWLLFLFPIIVGAQNSFCIENVRLFDGEAIFEKVNVNIVDGLIDEVSSKKIEADVVINGQGKFLMPAMTNAHVHVWSQFALVEAAQAGVLNVFDMHGVELYQGALVQLKDSINFASFYRAGAAATAPGGHGTQFGFPSPTLNSPEEAVAFVDERVKAGVDYLKIIVEPWKATLNEATVGALIAAAHAKDLLAVTHVSRADDALMVVKNNSDGLVHLWWDRPLNDKEIRELTDSNNFFVIPTLLTNILATEQIMKGKPDAKFLSKVELLTETKKLYDAGVPLLTGTDPPNVTINYGSDLYKEIKLMAEAGIPVIEVLKGTTSFPARYFKLDKKGFVKKGYRADLVLINGNPLAYIDDISKVEMVWKYGRLVERK